VALSSYEEKEELFKEQVGVYTMSMIKFVLTSDLPRIIYNNLFSPEGLPFER
jgi:hypothetical protein